MCYDPDPQIAFRGYAPSAGNVRLFFQNLDVTEQRASFNQFCEKSKIFSSFER